MPQVGEFMSVASIDWSTVFMLGNTFILFLLLKKLFFEKVKTMMDNRTAAIDDSIKKADAAKAEAAELKKKYEEGLKSARSEANDIVKAAQSRAVVQANDIIKAASEEAAILSRRAQEDILREKSKAVNEIKDEIGSLAVALAAKVVEKDMNTEDHQRLITQFMQELGDK